MQHAHNWEFLKEEISITDESTKKPCLEEKSQQVLETSLRLLTIRNQVPNQWSFIKIYFQYTYQLIEGI